MKHATSQYAKSDGKGWFDGDVSEKVMVLDSSDFPPGTEIIVVEPTCPECGSPRDLCEASGCVFCWYGVKGGDWR